MNSNEAYKLVQELDLDPIKFKLMHKESGEGWSQHKANAVEFEYRRFLYLIKMNPDEQVAPVEDVDTFWHYHILDTMKYAVDCDALFGYFVHHYPYAGMGGKDEEEAMSANADRSRALYEDAFPAGPAANPEACSAATAYCVVAGKPSYCVVSSKAAYCVVSSKPAYCVVASKPAYCVVSSKPAYCVVSSKPAYCVVSSKPAYCVVSSKPAYCVVSSKPAYCVVSSKPACLELEAA